jgi:hypothetical protein
MRLPLISWLLLALGASAALAALSSWQLTGGSTPSPARLSLVTDYSHTLDVRPAGVAVTRPLVPSAAGNGLTQRVTVRNATGGALRVQLRASRVDPALDQIVALRITLAGRTLYSGSLATLLRPTSASFDLRSHASAHLTLHMWLPATHSDAWHARVGTVTVSFVTTPRPGAA